VCLKHRILGVGQDAPMPEAVVDEVWMSSTRLGGSIPKWVLFLEYVQLWDINIYIYILITNYYQWDDINHYSILFTNIINVGTQCQKPPSRLEIIYCFTNITYVATGVWVHTLLRQVTAILLGAEPHWIFIIYHYKSRIIYITKTI